MKHNDEYLTSLQAAKYLHTTKNTLYRWHELGTLVPEIVLPHSGYRRYSKEQLDAFLDKGRHKPKEDDALPPTLSNILSSFKQS